MSLLFWERNKKIVETWRRKNEEDEAKIQDYSSVNLMKKNLLTTRLFEKFARFKIRMHFYLKNKVPNYLDSYSFCN